MGHTETRPGVPPESQLLTPDAPEIFRAPRVTLIARPEFVEPEHLKVRWKGPSSGGERLAEYAGRLCYMSQHNPIGRTTSEYLENIKKQGHAAASKGFGIFNLLNFQ